MKRFLSLVALSAPFTLSACKGDDGNLNVNPPELGVDPTSMDFGEVALEWFLELGVAVENVGYGDLEFSSIAFYGVSSDEFEITLMPESLSHGEAGELRVKYTPTAEGQDLATIELIPTDETVLSYQLPLTATGVAPEVDVDPETLSFGIIPALEQSTLPVSVGSLGSGDLTIYSISIIGDGAPFYSFSSPEYVEDEAGYKLANGFSLNLEVTFAPLDDLEQNAQLLIATNAVNEPLAIVNLYGNTADDPTTNTPPTVEILSPNNGEFFVDNVEVALSGHVVDPDNAMNELLCSWSLNGGGFASAIPDSAGDILNSSLLTAGDATLTLRCLDLAGDFGEDTVVVTVWPYEEPMEYVISGGATEFEYIRVDDDLTILLNGVAVYTDNDNTTSNIPPIAFEAALGDELEIIVMDENECDAFITPLTLHWGTGNSQELNDEVCLSSCDTHDCYDSTYNGPWPNQVLGETYTIAIP